MSTISRLQRLTGEGPEASDGENGVNPLPQGADLLGPRPFALPGSAGFLIAPLIAFAGQAL